LVQIDTEVLTDALQCLVVGDGIGSGGQHHAKVDVVIDFLGALHPKADPFPTAIGGSRQQVLLVVVTEADVSGNLELLGFLLQVLGGFAQLGCLLLDLGKVFVLHLLKLVHPLAQVLELFHQLLNVGLLSECWRDHDGCQQRDN